MVEGLSYLRTRRNVRMTFLLDVVAMVLAMPRVLFPAVGAVILGGGETTTGLLAAAIAVGSVLASTFSGGLGRVRRQGVAIVVAICAFGACTLGFGITLLVAGRTEPDGVLVPLLIVGGLFLVGSGVSDAISSVFRQTVLQSATPDHLRGRLQGVFIVVVAGGLGSGTSRSGRRRRGGARRSRPWAAGCCASRSCSCWWARIAPSCATTRATRSPDGGPGVRRPRGAGSVWARVSAASGWSGRGGWSSAG
ncbi:hypothetical protein [Litorihabitans aurantiacus]|uniref:MFS transporter n=1 Tax=Litorihabitans aurantiacus TaxID=1930061 RepID=A0AA37XI16_9MICO|nr:hypothetical protein [Litorihabitans aurantiacus]GMA33367.1 hypothetical protein GCM10025875_33590 [Litorihabitans aurantiacus]